MTGKETIATAACVVSVVTAIYIAIVAWVAGPGGLNAVDRATSAFVGLAVVSGATIFITAFIADNWKD